VRARPWSRRAARLGAAAELVGPGGGAAEAGVSASIDVTRAGLSWRRQPANWSSRKTSSIAQIDLPARSA